METLAQVPISEIFLSKNASVTGTNVYYSKVIFKKRLLLGIQLMNKANQSGTWEVWATNKVFPANGLPDETTDNDWCLLRIPDPIIQPSGGAAFSDYVDLSFAPFAAYRLKWTNIANTTSPEAYPNLMG